VKVVVTGGAGFIGSHLVDRLAELGYEVAVVDNLSSGSLENLEKHLGQRYFSFARADLKDPSGGWPSSSKERTSSST